jgi:hypothetical protein
MCTFAMAGCKSTSTVADPAGTGQLVSVDPSVAPSPTPSDPPTPTPTPSTKPTKKATPSAPPEVKEPGCAGQVGKSLSHTSIKKLLTSASKMNEYTDLNPASLPTEMNGVKPKVTIPLKLLRAIAYEESGWQSACQSNDGLGFGTMQVSADVQDFVNLKYGEKYDRTVPADNVDIAAADLEWLTVHFGILYFKKDFNLSTNSKLFDVVVAAYNVGQNAVVNADASKIQIGPKGSAYVQTVKGLMASTCPCQKWG